MVVVWLDVLASDWLASGVVVVVAAAEPSGLVEMAAGGGGTVREELELVGGALVVRFVALVPLLGLDLSGSVSDKLSTSNAGVSV